MTGLRESSLGWTGAGVIVARGTSRRSLFRGTLEPATALSNELMREAHSMSQSDKLETYPT
jgi:hypothetical protein